MVTLCELFVVGLFIRFFGYFAGKKITAMRSAGEDIGGKTWALLSWVGFLVLCYLCQLCLRVYYRPYLVYCSHFGD